MINLFAVLFGLYLLCLFILVYQRRKQGDTNSFDKEAAEKERRKENAGWLKVRTLEARENDLDEASRNELEQELGLVTLEASREQRPVREVAQAPSNPKRKKLLSFVCLAVGVSAGAIYGLIGNYGLVSLDNADDVLVLSAEVDRAELESHFTKLKSRVKKEPSDSKSAYLLGHAALKLEDYETASRAFASADRISQDDKNVKFFLLQAFYS